MVDTAKAPDPRRMENLGSRGAAALEPKFVACLSFIERGLLSVTNRSYFCDCMAIP